MKFTREEFAQCGHGFETVNFLKIILAKEPVEPVRRFHDVANRLPLVASHI